MSKRTLRVSRDGLTACPTCSAHIKVADPVEQTICPFCEHLVVAKLGRRRLFSDLGRSAVVAALLLGSATTVGCKTTQTDRPPTPADGSTPPAADAGSTADAQKTQDAGPDAGSDVVIKRAPRPPVQALYGVAPVPMPKPDK